MRGKELSQPKGDRLPVAACLPWELHPKNVFLVSAIFFDWAKRVYHIASVHVTLLQGLWQVAVSQVRPFF